MSRSRAIFHAKVRKAALRAGPPRTEKRPMSEAEAAQLEAARRPAEERLANLAAAPRCEAVAKSTGKRCGQPAMRGATRCRKHGGRLDVPDHPANIRRFWNGEHARSARIRAAWAQWGAAPLHIREAVTAHTSEHADIQAKAAGVRALQQAEHDGGTAWREWCNRVAHRREEHIRERRNRSE